VQAPGLIFGRFAVLGFPSFPAFAMRGLHGTALNRGHGVLGSFHGMISGKKVGSRRSARGQISVKEPLESRFD
jgi:hypothetical protein